MAVIPCETLDQRLNLIAVGRIAVPSSHSRRALVASTAALAAATIATSKAKKQKRKNKRKRKKQPPPLAFAMCAVTDVAFTTTADGFRADVSGAWHYPDAPPATTGGGTFGIPIGPIPYTAAGDAARSALITILRNEVAGFIASSGHDVPADRIAITVL